MERALEWLEAAAWMELEGCRLRAHDGTVLFTPDGQGKYGALWTRDLAYMVENAFHLLSPAEVRAAITYLLRGQRADGCIPDRVRTDGRPLYCAGPETSPLGDPPTDNAQFMVDLVYNYARHTGDIAFAGRHLPALALAMEACPRSAVGLVHIPLGRRQSPYGFTDTVGKTGELLFSSLLYWQACNQMAELCEWSSTNPTTYREQAGRIERGMDRLWDDHLVITTRIEGW